MISLAVSLSYYKKLQVQEAITVSCAGREVAVRYGERFGKRPDVILNPRDVWEVAKQGATSFHISEERWSNPLDIEIGMGKHQLDELRVGWDLVIDVDCQFWEYSKLITYLIIEVLQEEGISAIGCKFSGGKGFHIIVPFEAFPEHYGSRPMASVFPDVTRDILNYILDKVEPKFKFRIKDEILSKTGIQKESLKVLECSSCHSLIKKNEKGKKEFICPKCESRAEEDEPVPFRKCDRCGSIMRDMGVSKRIVCNNCGGSKFKEENVYDLSSIMNLDSVLISSRHLFRSPYSLHEKSGLVSLPVKKEEVLSFNKESADPKNIPEKLPVFIPSAQKNEASRLFENVFVFTQKKQARLDKAVKREFEPVTSALPESAFPPCMKLTLQGLKDGKKRAAFFLINFLSSVGWSSEMIEKRLLEWNEKNSPPLRKGYIQSQLKSNKNQPKTMLPPNCANPVYKEIGVCHPDTLCSTIKNPANYTIKKARRQRNEKANP